jgi:hypothetical protein
MNSRIIIAIGLITAVVGTAMAQTQPAPPKSLSATLETYVFPTEGQTPEQQSTDEAVCYNWAAENTGTDPFALQKEAQQMEQQSEQAQQATAQQIENFKKAFNVCLAGKKYLVKF